MASPDLTLKFPPKTKSQCSGFLVSLELLFLYIPSHIHAQLIAICFHVKIILLLK